MIDFDTCTKLPKSEVDLGKLIGAEGKSCPKSNKSPNMVTLRRSLLLEVTVLPTEPQPLPNIVSFLHPPSE